MKKLFLNTAFLLTTVTLVAEPVAAQEISTLFTSPEERAYLDFLREQFLIENQEDDFNIDEVIPAIPVITNVDEDAPPAITYYTLGGIIRQDNTRTIWLNDSSIAENNLPENMRLVTAGSSLLLRIQTEMGSFDLKSGQTLDVENGRILESWQRPAPVQAMTETERSTSEDNLQSQTQDTLPQNDAAASNQSVEPASNSGNLTISSEEIGALIGNDDPVAVTELLQILQIQEALPDDSIQ